MTRILEQGISSAQSRAWRWEHRVGFDETSFVKNVYFARYVSWQGCCREEFLATHAPDVLAMLENDLRLVTTSVGCDYYDELKAGDRVAIELRLLKRDGYRITLGFDYLLQREEQSMVARGFQEISCMRLCGNELVPTDLPRSLELALAPYAEAQTWT